MTTFEPITTCWAADPAPRRRRAGNDDALWHGDVLWHGDALWHGDWAARTISRLGVDRNPRESSEPTGRTLVPLSRLGR